MKKQDTVAVILAAGQGTRMNKKYNKLLLPLGTRTIVEYSLDAFLDHRRIRKIFLAVSSKDLNIFENLFPRSIVLVQGGERRQDSVSNAMRKIMEEKKIPELVLIHDGARPFCTRKLIDRIIDSTNEFGAAIPVLPVTDTIRNIREEKIKVIDRNNLFSVQTPQGFRTKLINKALNQAIKKNLEVTDDASLIESMGGKVKAIKGEYQNFKITTPEDLDRANFILNAKNLS